jgi:hypothetical protein
MAEQDLECPVCFEPLTGQGTIPEITDNSLICRNGHLVCLECARCMIEPCEDNPCGFHIRCPMCRRYAKLSRLHLLVIMKGSWQKSRAMFRTVEDASRWYALERRNDTPSDGPPLTRGP